MKTDLHFPCDICSAAPSFAAASDLLEVPSDFAGATMSGPNDRRFVFAGRRRFGCEKHPPIAACYNLDGSIALTLPEDFERDRERETLLRRKV